MKHITDEQLENDLIIFSAMQQVGSPGFFYKKLNERMAKDIISTERKISIKYLIVICTLTLFLCINIVFSKHKQTLDITTNDQRIDAITAAYDQTI